MPSGTFVFPEWLNANSVRAYPIMESASRVSLNGEITLPNSLIVDARINAPHGHATGTFFVSHVEILPDRVAIDISYHDGTSATDVATITANVGEHSRNQAYPFAGVGTNHAVMGVVILGELEDAVSRVLGSFSFESSSTEFEIGTLNISQPMIEYVSLVERGLEIGRLGRVVKLRAGSNIRLTRLDAETIRIDGISGENLDDCPAEPEAPPVLTINGAPPDADGNVELVGSECIQISSAGLHTIQFRDLCSTSCCGCSELSSLISSLDSLQTQQADLREMVYRAYTELQGMVANLTSFLRA